MLPVPLTGPAYFVSHGGEAFPSLIIVLQGYGATVDLVGSTFISKAGITSSTFKTIPDVPVGSFELTLPQGPVSALTANGANLCNSKLAMPTEFVGQNGVVLHQNTKIVPTGCGKTKKAAHRGKKAAHKKRKRKAKGRKAAGGRRRRKGSGVMAMLAVSSRAPGGSDERRSRGPAGQQGVGEIQRARIVAAMGELVRERGAGGVTIAYVVARSGVSRRTFYELFTDREDCFLAVFDIAVARAAESVLPAYEAPGKWRERVRAGLDAVLRFLDNEPELGYLCVVGALGSGERALERRTNVVLKMVDALHAGGIESRAARQPERLVAEGLVGAVLAVIHARLVERPTKPLLFLLNPLMGMIVLPYLGKASSERERRYPAPRARRPSTPRVDPLPGLECASPIAPCGC